VGLLAKSHDDKTASKGKARLFLVVWYKPIEEFPNAVGIPQKKLTVNLFLGDYLVVA
jgi:hypothetical protein